MTDIDRMVAVMQAFKEGRAIQYRARGSKDTDKIWDDAPNPRWDWSVFDYRVKPAPPRRIWVNMYCNRMGFAHASREQADANGGDVSTECVEFVEVVK